MTPLETLKLLRLNYPTPMGRDNNGALLNLVCLAHRQFAMYAKPDDNSAILPDGTRVSRDTLIDLRTLDGYDCLRDSEGAAEPVWNLNHEHVTDPQRIVMPVSAEPGPTPIPPTPIPPTPQPPAVDLGPVLQRIDTLERGTDALFAELFRRLDALKVDVNADRKISGRQSGWAGGSISGTVTKG